MRQYLVRNMSRDSASPFSERGRPGKAQFGFGFMPPFSLLSPVQLYV